MHLILAVNLPPLQSIGAEALQRLQRVWGIILTSEQFGI